MNTHHTSKKLFSIGMTVLLGLLGLLLAFSPAMAAGGLPWMGGSEMAAPMQQPIQTAAQATRPGAIGTPAALHSRAMPPGVAMPRQNHPAGWLAGRSFAAGDFMIYLPVVMRNFSANSTPPTPTVTVSPTSTVTASVTPTSTLTATPTTQPLSASDVSLIVDGSAPVSFNLANLVAAADGSTLAFSLPTAPLSGTATLNGSQLTYTPTLALNGADGLAYRVQDGLGSQAQGHVRFSPGAAQLGPEGGIVVGVDGFAIGAAEGTLTDTVTISIKRVALPPIPLPEYLLVHGSFYQVNGTPGASTIESESPLMFGIPVPEGVPTTTLAVAVFNHQEAVTTTDYSAGSSNLTFENVLTETLSSNDWPLIPGKYDPLHNLFLIYETDLYQEGEVIALVTTSDLQAPIQIIDSQIGNSADLQGSISQNQETSSERINILLATITPRPISVVLAIDSYHNTFTPTEQIVTSIITHSIEVIQWYKNEGFTPPLIRKYPNTIAGDKLYPRVASNGSYLIYLWAEMDNICQFNPQAGFQPIGGMYFAQRPAFIPGMGDQTVVLCITPTDTQIKSSLKSTIAHEIFHAVQRNYVSVTSTPEKIKKYFTEGAASLAGGTYVNSFQIGRDTKNTKRNLSEPLIFEAANNMEKLHYQAQDFWIYLLNSNPSKGGFRFLHNIMLDSNQFGANGLDRKLTTLFSKNLASVYWDFAKDQIYEHKVDDGDGYVSDLRCTYYVMNLYSNVTEITLSASDSAGIPTTVPTPVALKPLSSYAYKVTLNGGPEDREAWFTVTANQKDNIRVAFYEYKDNDTTCDGNKSLDGETITEGKRLWDIAEIPANRMDMVIAVVVSNISFNATENITLDVKMLSPQDDPGLTASAGGGAININVLDNDNPETDRNYLTVYQDFPGGSETPGKGTLSTDGKTVTYTPPSSCTANFTDEFKYRIGYKKDEIIINGNDGKNIDKNSAKVTIEVTCPCPQKNTSDDSCEPPPPPPIPPTGGGHSWGDPHNATPDGAAYDTMSFGEFIFLQPRPGYEGITVQVRQIPWSNGSPVAINTAVAIQADGTIFQFGPDGLYINHEQRWLPPGLYDFGDVDLKVNGPASAEVTYSYYHFKFSGYNGSYINITFELPLDDSHIGLIGRPNGDRYDDLLMADGSTPEDIFAFAGQWRIRTLEQSLFTYRPGEGPWTFNRLNPREMPSPEDLAPYREQALALIHSACSPGANDDILADEVSLELYFGRTPEDLANTSLCFYEVNGTVSNTLVPGLMVPGAKISVLFGPEDVACEAWSDRQGRYQCRFTPRGHTGQFTVQISGRGQATASAEFLDLPPAGGVSAVTDDLAVAPTTVLLTGVVRDQLDHALYNAEVRLEGPQNAGFARAYTQTGASGEYSMYVMFDDGVLAGENTYHISFNPEYSTEPNAPLIAATQAYPFSGLNEHALNTLPQDLQLVGVQLRFSGQVAYQFDPTIRLPDMRVIIEPTMPHPDFDSCDVLSQGNGIYTCDVALAHLDPFDARLQLIGSDPADIITTTVVHVDPAGYGAGEIVNVVTPFLVDAPMLHLTGQVVTPAGAPVVGAQVQIHSSQALVNRVQGQAGPDGRYDLYLPLAEGVISGTLEYTIDYLELTVELATAFEGAAVGQILEIPQDFTVSGGALVFTGRVINLATGEPLPDASVTIRSTNGEILCVASTDVAETYAYLQPDGAPCRTKVQASAPETIELVYQASGYWGSATFTNTVALPDLGASRSVPQDLFVTTSMLHLTGSVTRPSGAPLAGAIVRASVGAGKAFAYSDPTGHYDMPLILPAGTLNGTISYEVSYRQSSNADSQAFTAAYGQITELARDLNYGYRTIYFRGKIGNAYDVQMPMTQVVIEAAEIMAAGGTQCVTQSEADGSYVCVAQLNAATTAFVANYTVSGMWGQPLTASENIAIDPTQDILEYPKDFQSPATVLHLTGQVANSSGEPQEGVSILVSSSALVQISQGQTDAQGNYDFYAALRPGAGSQISDTLAYRVGYGSASNTYTVDFVALPYQETLLQENFIIDLRVISFKGKVRNTFSAQGLTGTSVLVTSPTLGELCEYNDSKRYSSTHYACDARIYTDQPFDVIYQLDGDWGTAVIAGRVETLPDLGQRITIEQDLWVSPTTLQIGGQIADRDGQPIGGAMIQIDGAGFYDSHSIQVQSDGSGNYLGYATLDPLYSTIDLHYRVRAGVEGQMFTIQRSLVVTPTINALTPVAENFNFPYRRVAFSGRLINETDPTINLDGSLLIVSPSLDQVMCSTNISTISGYQCSALISNDDPFTVTYRVEGYWGVVLLENRAVEAGASNVAQNLAAAPRLLRIVGQVTTPDGVPLSASSVEISSLTVAPGQKKTWNLTTNANGFYTTTAVLAEGVTDVLLTYKAQRNGSTASVQARFTLDPGEKVSLARQDLILNSGRITFSGDLINTLAPSENATWPYTSIVIDSPTLGRLCEAGSTGGYECSRVITATQSFDAVYHLYGSWGSKVITEHVTSLPPIGGNMTWVKDIAITPSMLRVYGMVLDANGLPVPGLRARASSPIIASEWASLPSNADGILEIWLMLKQVEGSLQGSVSLAAGAASGQASFTAFEGTLTTVDAGQLEFPPPSQARQITILGQLINAVAPGIPAARPSGHVLITSPSVGAICEVPSGSSYSCSAIVYDAEPFEVLITASGPWGSVQKEARLETPPPAGGAATLGVDVEVNPTTAHLSGRITSPEGEPLPNASVSVAVRLDNIAITDHGAGNTDINGQYDFYILLPSWGAQAILTYTVGYDGMAVRYQVNDLPFNNQALNQWTQNLTFTPRRVTFTGQIINQVMPQVGVPASVHIADISVAPHRYCNASVSRNSNVYSCSIQVNSAAPLTVTYSINGDWGSLTLTRPVNGIGDAGQTTFIEQDFSANPTMMRFFGTLTDGYGKPLSNAGVFIGGEALVQGVSATTDISGTYEAYAILDANTINGDLMYQITYYNASRSLQRSFSGATRNTMNHHGEDFEIELRTVTFAGRVRNALLPGMDLGGHLTITSPTEGTLCDQNYPGAYECQMPNLTTQPFTVTYQITGDWGSQVLTGTVPFGAAGSNTRITRNIAIAPTMLRLVGRVQDGDGTPLANASLRVTSDALAPQLLAMQTDAQGLYTATVMVKGSVITGTLAYQITYQSIHGGLSKSFTATPGQINEISQNITLVARRLNLSGRAVNAWATDMPLAGAQIVISAEGLGDLCTLTASAQGNYACTVEVARLEAVNLTYTLSDDWGSAAFNATAPAGNVGSQTTLTQDLAAHPTTLRLSGSINDSNGTPLAGASVRIASENLSRIAPTTTNSDAGGRYNLVAIFQNEVTTDTLQFTIEYNGISLQSTASLVLPAGQFSSLEKNFTLASRQITFSGTTRNALAENLPLRAAQLSITAAGRGALCITSMYGAAYSCNATINNLYAIPITYTVSGDWGSAVLTDTIPASGVGSQGVVRDLGAAPLTVRISGLVRDPQNNPLEGASVSVAGAGLSTGNAPNVQVQANGQYTLYAVIRPNFANGTLVIQVDDQGASVSRTVPYTVIPGQLASINLDVTFDQRLLVFTGKLPNSFVTGMNVYAESVRVEATPGGLLCQGTVHKQTREYHCQASVSTVSAMDANYQISADWGTATLTGTVPAGSVGSQTITQDLAVSPTTLHLHGVVRDTNSIPLQNASLTLNGNGLSAYNQQSQATDGSGHYDLYAILNDGVTEAGLNLAVTYNGWTIVQPITVTAAANQLTDMAYDVTFNQRSIVFDFNNGIRNMYAPTTSLPSTRVTVALASGETLCVANYFSSNGFQCRAGVMVTEAFSATYTVEGAWGSQVVTGTAPAGGAGSIRFGPTLYLSPTTLLLSGILVDESSKPLGGASVSFHGNDFVSGASVNTDANGQYSQFIVLRNGATHGTLGLAVSYNAITLDDSIAFTATQKQLTPLTHNITFDRRRLDFSGKIYNANAPTMSLGKGQVAINAIDLAAPCIAQVSSSTYTCNGVAITTEPFSVTYTVSGDWPTVLVSGSIPAGSFGSSLPITRDVLVYPTTLYLTGVVRDAGGAFLPGATISLSGSVLSTDNFESEQTNSNGQYSLYAVLKNGVTSGQIDLAVGYNGATIHRTVVFTAAASQLTSISIADTTFNQRLIQFRGNVQNSLVSGMNLNNANVAVQTIGGQQLCSDNTESSSYYSCDATITTGEAMSVTYTVSGDWGTSVIAGVIPAGSIGSTTVSRNLGVAPTTLQIGGVVSRPTGEPLASVQVSVNGGVLSANNSQTVSTNANGGYTLYAVLDAGVASGSLEVVAVSQGATVRRSFSFSNAVPNQVTPVTQNITFDQRRVNFNGVVRNAFTNLGLYGNSVTISAASVGTLCSDTYLYHSTYGYGYYDCYANVIATEAFSVTYTVSGDWGTAILTDTVPAGNPGTTTNVSRNILASPLTLLLQGIVRDMNGQPLGGASVSVSGSNLSYNNAQSIQTASNGSYSLYAVLDDGATSGSFSLSVSYNALSVNRTFPYTATVGQITTLSLDDVVFNQRQARFYGYVQNALAGNLNIGATRVTVASPGLGTLCTYSYSYGEDSYYSCYAALTIQAALPISYTIQGGWGTQVITGTLPAGLGSQTLQRNLGVSPTTLHISGIVSNASGNPLSGVSVSASGNGIGSFFNTSDSTDANGRYDLYVALRENVSSGVINVTATSNNIQVSQPINFTAPANQLTELTQNLAFTSRRIWFSGNIYNVLAAGLPAKVTGLAIASPETGNLCSYNISPNTIGAAYGCEAIVVNTQAFSVTYTATGLWGSAVITGSVPAGSSGGSMTVSRRLDVPATMLQASGVVRDGNGNPIPNAWMQISGAGVSESVTGQTNAQGRYEILAFAAAGGTLTYTIDANGTRTTFEHTLPAITPNSINPVGNDFTLTQQRVYFQGSLYNTQAGNRPLGDNGRTQIAVHSGGTLLCETSTFSLYGAYVCNATVSSSTSLDLEYTVSGSWGSTALAQTVAITRTGQGVLAARQDIAISPATLHLNGSVLGTGGAPITNTLVAVNGAALHLGASGYTDASGHYALDVLLAAGISQGELVYSAGGYVYTHTFTSPAGTITFDLNAALPAGSQFIETVAGIGSAGYGYDNSPAINAYINRAHGVAIGTDGSLYIADTDNNRIRRVAPDGIITTVAGNGTAGYSGDGGPATSARIAGPLGVAVGPDGSLYISDSANCRIRKVTTDGVITTIAGNNCGYSGDGGPAANAQFNGPYNLSVGPDGSLYIADASNYRIRRINPDGIITTVAGNGNYGSSGDGGPATQARLSYPKSVVVGLDGSLYIADSDNNRIRRVTPDGIITTVAGNGSYGYSGDGGPATSAQLRYPYGVTLGPDGSLYITDTGNARVRRVAPDGIIATVAGTGDNGYNDDGGPAINAYLYSPTGIVAGPDGNLYLADSNNHRIRRVGAPTLVITGAARAPDGTPLANTAIRASSPLFIRDFNTQTDEQGQFTLYPLLFNRESQSGALELQAIRGGVVVTQSIPIAIDAGIPQQLNVPITLADQFYTFSGVIYHADDPTQRLGDFGRTHIAVRSAGNLLCETNTLSFLGSYACSASLPATGPFDVAYTLSGSWGSVVTTTTVAPGSGPGTHNQVIRDLPVTPSTLHLSGVVRGEDGQPISQTLVSVNSAALHLGASGYTDESGAYTLDVILMQAAAQGELTYSAGGNVYTHTFTASTPGIVYDLDEALSEGSQFIETMAGDGETGYGYEDDGNPATHASLYEPYGVAVAPDGSLYIAERYNHRIRRVGPDGIITTVAGNGNNGFYGDGGLAVEASINYPEDVAIGPDGSLYIADTGNCRIRRVAPDGIITSVAGDGGCGYNGDGGLAVHASLSYPEGIAIGPDGSLFIADSNNQRIRQVTPDGTITTIAGNGTYGYDGDGGLAISASFGYPTRVAFGPDGSLFIADSDNHCIRRITPDGTITTVAGNGGVGYGGDGGLAISASFAYPMGIALGPDGSLYIADSNNNRIRRVDTDGIITTIAGDGNYGYIGDGAPAANAQLYYPVGMALGPDGSLYVVDRYNQRIRRVGVPALVLTGSVITPDGTPIAGADIQIAGPLLNADVDTQTNAVGQYRFYPSLVSKLSQNGVITFQASRGGVVTTADVPITVSGGVPVQLNVALTLNGQRYTFTGALHLADDPARRLGDDGRTHVAIRSGGALLCESDSFSYYGTYACSATSSATEAFITEYSVSGSWGSQVLTTTVTPGAEPGTHNLIANDLAVSPTVLYLSGTVRDDAGQPVSQTLVTVSGETLHLEASGYTGQEGDYDLIVFLMEDITDGELIYQAGGNLYTHTFTTAAPEITFDLLEALPEGSQIIETAGNWEEIYSSPQSVVLDVDGNLYVADGNYCRVLQVDLDGNVTTIAGNESCGYNGDHIPALEASLSYPMGMALGPDGSLYIADSNNQRIRRVGPDGIITTVAGNGGYGDSGDGGPAAQAQLAYPSGVAVAPDGSLYIADRDNQRIRWVGHP